MMRLLPRSPFGRMMLVLASGLIVAQLLSAAINLAKRDTVLVRAVGMQPAQRIADVVRLLDSLGPAERAIVGILNIPRQTANLPWRLLLTGRLCRRSLRAQALHDRLRVVYVTLMSTRMTQPNRQMLPLLDALVQYLLS